MGYYYYHYHDRARSCLPCVYILNNLSQYTVCLINSIIFNLISLPALIHRVPLFHITKSCYRVYSISAPMEYSNETLFNLNDADV